MKTRHILLLVLLMVCGGVSAQMKMNLTMKNGEKVSYNVSDIASVEWGEDTDVPETSSIEVNVTRVNYILPRWITSLPTRTRISL